MQRRHRILSSLLQAVLLLVSCSEHGINVGWTPGVPSDVYSAQTGQAETTEAMTSEINIFMEEGAQFSIPATVKAGGVLQRGHATIERLFPDAGEWEARHREAGLHRWFKVSFSSPVSARNAAEELRATDGVLEVEEPVDIRCCAATDGGFPFNDPYGPRQWQYLNDGLGMSGFVKGCDINVVPVWKKFTGGKANVIVAVVDQGIDMSHPDLRGVVIPAGKNGSKNFCDDNYVIEGKDHGTHVAGLIAAINNNGIGCSSVAGGLDGTGGVRLLSCQIFKDNPDDKNHSLTGNIADAIVWGADHGAVICQNSWGYSFSSESQAKNARISDSHKAAIDYFIKYAGIDRDGRQSGPMKGGIVFFSAGNDNWQYALPASYEEVIAVGAAGPDARKATYSNHGPWVDICAPGGERNRFLGNNETPCILSLSNTPKSYAYKYGTSMACPLVSGVAALIVSQFGGQGFTNKDLKGILLGSADKELIPASDDIGGMVDAYAAFAGLADRPTFTTRYDGDYKMATGEICAIDYTITEADRKDGTYSITMESDGSAVLTVTGADRCSVRFITTEANIGTHTAVLKARSSEGRLGTLSLEYVIYRNEPPVITLSQSGDRDVMWHETLPVLVTVKDPEGNPQTTCSIKAFPENVCDILETADGYEVRIGKGDGAFSGTFTLSIRAEDIFGAVTDTTVSYTVLPDRAPVVKSGLSDIMIKKVGERKTLNMADIFYDPDGESLRYTTTVSDSRVAEMAQSLGIFFLKAIGNGTSVIKVTAIDGLGKTADTSFRLGVYDDSKGPTLYPNPVRDTLRIRIGEENDISIEMYTETGRRVLSAGGRASIFTPLEVDLGILPPGRYLATVTCGSASYKKDVIKQ